MPEVETKYAGENRVDAVFDREIRILLMIRRALTVTGVAGMIGVCIVFALDPEDLNVRRNLMLLALAPFVLVAISLLLRSVMRERRQRALLSSLEDDSTGVDPLDRRKE